MIQITDFGFKEAKNKPNLYYKNIDEKMLLFFDFRQQDYDLNDSFYFKILKEPLKEERTFYSKIIINEFFKVVKGLHVSVDFYDITYCDICEKQYCISYDDEFSVCSKNCYEKSKKEMEEYKVKQIYNSFELREFFKCGICKKAPKLDLKNDYYCYVEETMRHNHHTDYRKNKEKTIKICPSCHAKITFHLDKYPELKKYKPVGKREELIKKKKEKFCKTCGNLLQGRRRIYCRDGCNPTIRERERKAKARHNTYVHNYYINADKYRRGIEEKHQLVLKAFENTGEVICQK